MDVHTVHHDSASSAATPASTNSTQGAPASVASAIFDPSTEYCIPDMVFFWKPPSPFSRWTPSTFTVDGVVYSCAEQFFAAKKARLFGDRCALQNIMRVSDPDLHKNFGRELGNVLCEYHDVFSSSPTDFGSCSLFPFKLAAPGSAPVTSRPYRVNPPVVKQVDAILDQYLAAGLIQHSTSPHSSPLVVIPKKSGGVRITVDRCKLNKLCALSQLPIPRVDDTLDKLLKGQIYSLFDMKSSFHQITVHRDTIPSTAFVTSSGLFEWLRCLKAVRLPLGGFAKLSTKSSELSAVLHRTWMI
ncbi:unnamed protein product [Ectocarpus sp. CCAP 1310/34]|nr:unnamed protein product [Ectocarpus sp. CCAP 1310/34]